MLAFECVSLQTATHKFNWLLASPGLELQLSALLQGTKCMTRKDQVERYSFSIRGHTEPADLVNTKGGEHEFSCYADKCGGSLQPDELRESKPEERCV